MHLLFRKHRACRSSWQLLPSLPHTAEAASKCSAPICVGKILKYTSRHGIGTAMQFLYRVLLFRYCWPLTVGYMRALICCVHTGAVNRTACHLYSYNKFSSFLTCVVRPVAPRVQPHEPSTTCLTTSTRVDKQSTVSLQWAVKPDILAAVRKSVQKHRKNNTAITATSYRNFPPHGTTVV